MWEVEDIIKKFGYKPEEENRRIEEFKRFLSLKCGDLKHTNEHSLERGNKLLAKPELLKKDIVESIVDFLPILCFLESK